MGKSYFALSRMKWSFHSLNFSPRQGATASSYTLRPLSGITRSASMPITWPKPSQVGQAPTGSLKLNRLGEGSSKVIPSRSNLSLNPNCRGFPWPSSPSRINSPCPSKKPLSALSAVRLSFSASSSVDCVTVRRSITRNQVPFGAAFALSTSSIRCTVVPSCTRAYPCCCRIPKCSFNVRPAGSRIGASISTMLPTGKVCSPCTTSSTVLRFTSWPEAGE